MTLKDTPQDHDSIRQRIEAEIADSFDEELELELDDGRLEKLLGDMADHPNREMMDRQFYFNELFRLQRELVKLQDWVVTQKLKVVVLFEGRDGAGKGGWNEGGAHHAAVTSRDQVGIGFRFIPSGAAFRDEDVLNPVTDEITALAPRLMAFGEDRVIDDPLVIHGASIQPELTRRQRDGRENFPGQILKFMVALGPNLFDLCKSTSRSTS